MKVVIIGGGIIGAAIAHRLNATGANVTVIEGAPGATPASFGWINASFYLNADHFALRSASIDAWRRMGAPVTWSGCLCWEDTGAAFDRRRDELTALRYEVDEIDAQQFAALEREIAAPDRALHFTQEAVAEPAHVTETLLAGVRRISGVHVTGLETANGAISGVSTAMGVIPADRVVVAAGTGSPTVLGSVGVTLPMLERPGLMLRTAPLPSVMRHILVAPGQELRQDERGHIWAPTSVNHQSDDASTISTSPDKRAEATLERLRKLLPRHKLAWDRIMMAARPVPEDGLPVIGACGPAGLFIAVMHSGVTLAAITAEALAPQVMEEVPDNTLTALVAPFTPDRFQSA